MFILAFTALAIAFLISYLSFCAQCFFLPLVNYPRVTSKWSKRVLTTSVIALVSVTNLCRSLSEKAQISPGSGFGWPEGGILLVRLVAIVGGGRYTGDRNVGEER